MKSCIVILSFNHPELTAKTIRSALKFNMPIVLIHNGSEVRHIKRLKDEFCTIDHFQLIKNIGFAGGVNCGLAYTFEKYDWILFLTNDTELMTIGEFPKLPAFIAPLIFFRKVTKIDSKGGVFDPRIGKLMHLKNYESLTLKKHNYFYVPGTAFIIHKEIFNEVGMFDEALHTYWEDVDFSMRVHQAKKPIYYDGSFSLLHKVGKTCHDNPFYTTYLFKRNRKKVSLKYLSFLMKIYFIFNFAIESITIFVRLFLRKDKVRMRLYWKAIVD